MPDTFDLIILGAGPGGYVAAIRAAQLGKKVALVEKRSTFGGTCLNIGCIPSKALLDSSELYSQAKSKLTNHGIHVGDVRLDLARLLARKDDVVKKSIDGIAFLMKKNRITTVQGVGRLAGQGKVIVTQADGTNRELAAPAIVLATGSEPAPLPPLPFNGKTIVSSTEALGFDKVPAHLIVVGGGYIGLELGSVWARLGSRVTVIEFLPRILAPSDSEVALLLHRSLAKQGMEFHFNTKVVGSAPAGEQIAVRAQAKTGEEVTFTGDKVLVAVGRKPYIDGLGLKEAGVVHDPKSGRVTVDEHFQTNVPGVYAIGDLIAGPMLAHKASEEGIALVERLAGIKTHVNYNTIPSVIFTHPELSSVGLTEEQVKESGQPYKVGKFPFAASGRARALDEIEGLVKVITHEKTDRILGVHILGPRASELIAEVVMAMEYSASAEDVARVCHSHPTLSEAVGEAARAAWQAALHT